MSHLARSNPARLRRVPMSRWLPTLSLACALLVPAFAETVVKFGEELEKVDPDVQAIELKLKQQKVSLDFEEASLSEVIEFIRIISGINIVIDPAVFEDRTEEELQITLNVKDLALENALQLILDLKDLKRSFKHSVMMISSPESEKKEFFFKVYDVHDLMFVLEDFPGPEISLDQDQETGPSITLGYDEDQGNNPFSDADTVLDLIQTNVDPESWDEEKASISLSNGLLIVTNTREVQIKVRKFLDELRAMR